MRASRGAVACATLMLLSAAAVGAALRSEPSRLSDSSTSAAHANATFRSKEEAFAWAKKNHRRLLHVVYRVGDMDRTIKFYTECLGMKLLRKRDIPEEKYTNAFLGYGREDAHFVVELTYNYGVDKYDIGAGFGHFGIATDEIAISTDDVYKTAEVVKLSGGQVVREPGPLPGIGTKITSVLDPDGWKTVFVDNIDFAKELGSHAHH